MRFFLKLASAAYISGIFFLAGSSVVERLGQFNPYSLLHIPLYGILTLLLILSKWSSIFTNRANPANSTNSKDPTNPTNSKNPTNSSNLAVAGIIALVVAIADEIHQSFIPFRDASVTDVFLDLIGVLLALSLILYLYRKKQHSTLSFEP
jgi:VanZ like family